MFSTSHLPTLGLLAGLAAASLGTAGTAAAASQEFVAIEHAGTNPVTDIGTAGDSTGDILTFSNEVFDAGNVDRIGTSQGSCVRTVVAVKWECTWSVSLADGQITLQGPYYDSGASTFAVTGGTGAFGTAAGELVVSPIGTDGKASNFDFRLQGV
ncbi:Allene oxide cyclase [Mycolicibacterium sp. CH28]|uniref:allene oxide cyclase family protein n=1 Tax=Mycolicibacterium sp. CH28 TaxID=2512237 RepID=UPI001082035F|nr:allene oxide cyclase family protein [Mycolicibacterium sp. CH28]TGD90764.1 Allene oxide cyclase [Mycolicibacterium sp. CH28]